jgi:metallo-beta-lactamase class B
MFESTKPLSRRRARLGALALAALACAVAPTSAQELDPTDVGVVRPSPPAPVIKPTARPHLEAAKRAAGSDFVSALLLCNIALPEGQKLAVPTAAELRARGGSPDQPPPAAKAFDNLYYLGIRRVSAWAVDTPEGIIVIDALNNRADAEQAIEGGLRKLGADPARIKYIIVTHGHPDHYGGAKYLADKYKARVLMSAYDWKLAEAFGKQQLSRPDFGPPPTQDMIVTDGQKLELGGEAITMHITPGHTRGTISLLIPVTDRGKRHVAALWGGTGFNFQPSVERFKQYSQSAQRFLALAEAANADVMLSNHPENDNAIVHNDRLSRRTGADPNPYVSGREGVRGFLTAYGECAETFRSQMEP